jgi:hypothetical protein
MILLTGYKLDTDDQLPPNVTTAPDGCAEEDGPARRDNG